MLESILFTFVVFANHIRMPMVIVLVDVLEIIVTFLIFARYLSDFSQNS